MSLPPPLRSPRVLVGLAVVLAVAATAILAPWLAPHDPAEQNLVSLFLPPAWMDGKPLCAAP